MTAGSLLCDGCGAPNPASAGACAYCGAAIPPPAPPAPLAAPLSPLGLAPDAGVRYETYCPQCGQLHPSEQTACPRCPPLNGEMAGGDCPRCRASLVPESMGDILVDRCPACRGVWFDRGEIGSAIDLRTRGLPREQVQAIDHALATRPRTALVADPSLSCVRCRSRMERRAVAPRSDILVDLCKSHGIWFDAGEIERFREFVAAGGLEILRRWEEDTSRPLSRPSARQLRRRHNLSEQDGYGQSDGMPWWLRHM